MKSISKDLPATKHKPIDVQHLGNITGRRGAGMSTVGGGDQLAHSLNHYGKDPPQLVSEAMPIFPGMMGRRR